MKVVLDSNILISALNRNDCKHSESAALIKKLDEGQHEILVPILFLWEFAAYQYNTEKSKVHVSNAGAEFHITAIDVTVELFWRTHSEAMVNVKGADRVFVSLAKDEDAPLITNDGAILKYAGQMGISAISLSEFLTTKL